MKRRSLLAALGAAGASGLTGCLDLDGSASGRATTDAAGGPGSPIDSTTTTATHDGGVQRRISIADQDAVADEYELAFDVTVLDPLVTTAHLARIRVEMTNEGPTRAFSAWGGMCDLFNRSRGGSDDPRGLWLHDPERARNIDRKDGRWEADRDADAPRGYPAYGCGTKHVGTDESVTSEYVVWDDYRIDGYLTPGTYRWEETVTVATDADTRTSDRQRRSVVWGFSLRVTDPDA